MTLVTLPNGLEIVYEAVGKGPAVLFIHGWATSRRVWAGQLADLADDFRLVAYDARGCGESGRPALGYTIEQGARDALAIADAIGLDRFSLVGSSLGGNVALEAALKALDRVERLVLVDAPLHWFATGLPRAELEAWLERLRADRFATVEAMVPGWFGPNARDALNRATISQIIAADWAIDALIRDAAEHDRRDAMRGLTVPTTLLHGALDPEIPVSVSYEAAALMPDARVEVLEGLAHMPHLEDRVRFGARLGAILNGTAR